MINIKDSPISWWRFHSWSHGGYLIGVQEDLHQKFFLTGNFSRLTYGQRLQVFKMSTEVQLPLRELQSILRTVPQLGYKKKSRKRSNNSGKTRINIPLANNIRWSELAKIKEYKKQEKHTWNLKTGVQDLRQYNTLSLCHLKTFTEMLMLM